MRKEQVGYSTLYLTDCMELMATLPDKSIDLAIVDPPFGGITASGEKIQQAIGGTFKKYGKNGAENWNVVPDQTYFTELFRVSKRQIICGGNYFDLPKIGGWIVWDKCVAPTYPNFSKCELLWTSFLGHVEMTKASWSGFIGLDVARRIHPTQKPINLYKYLLRYAKQGDKILDTHFGSGSIAVACNELGFNLTACEIDADYFTAACNRVREANRQGQLFREAV